MVSTELKTSMVIAARAARACDMCGKERARWYCAADEAYLCERCDESVHSANTVAKRHERSRLGPDGAPAKLKASSHHNRKISSDDSNGTDISITPEPREADVKKWCNTSRKRSRTTRRSANISGHPFLNSNAPAKLKPTNLLVTESKDDANLLFYDLLSADDHLVSHHSDSPPYEVKLEPVSPSSTLTSRDQPGMNLEGNDFTHEVPVYEPFLQDLMDSTEEDLMEKLLPSSPSVGDVSCGSGASTSIINTETLPSDCKAVKQKMSVEAEGELNLSDLVDSSGGDAIENVSISEDSDIDTFDVMDLCSNTNFVDTVKMEELNEDFSYTNAWKSTYRYEQGACASIFDGNPFKGKGERDCDLRFTDVQHGKCLQQCTQQMGTHKPLSLHLNYEEVICAWSDRGSFWLDGQRPQIVPDINFMNHGIADCSMIIVTESQTNTSVCSQAGHVPSLVVIDKGREARVLRYKEKRRTRLFSKRIRYEVRKLNAERRPRMKGRFVKRAAMATLAAM